MRENLRLAAGEDQRQFMREPFPIVQDLRAVFFLFFPMICELDGSPVGDMPVFSISEYPVKHSCGT